MKTVDFLDAVKRQHAIASDYAVAQVLGLTRAQVSKYRTGKDFMGDDVALKVAEMLGLDPGYVMACAHAERSASDAARAAWERVAARLKSAGVAALAGLALLGATGGPDGGAQARTLASAHSGDGQEPGSVRYVKSRRRRARWVDVLASAVASTIWGHQVPAPV